MGKPFQFVLKLTRNQVVKECEELLERVEDVDDVAWLKRARKKTLNYRPLENYLAERKRK